MLKWAYNRNHLKHLPKEAENLSKLSGETEEMRTKTEHSLRRTTIKNKIRLRSSTISIVSGLGGSEPNLFSRNIYGDIGSDRLSNVFGTMKMAKKKTRKDSGMLALNFQVIQEMVEAKNETLKVDSTAKGNEDINPVKNAEDQSIDEEDTKKDDADLADGVSKQIMCIGCNEVITDSQVLNVEEKVYHMKCFKCNICNKQITGIYFKNENGSFMCKDDYKKIQEDFLKQIDKMEEELPTCDGCGLKINDNYVKVADMKLHRACFSCDDCKNGITGLYYDVKKEGKEVFYCENCYIDNIVPKCSGCQRPVLPKDVEDNEKSIVCGENQYHVKCFRCRDCNRQLTGQVFFMDQDEPLCYDCLRNREKSRPVTP